MGKVTQWWVTAGNWPQAVWVQHLRVESLCYTQPSGPTPEEPLRMKGALSLFQPVCHYTSYL